jgi:hypothetical protein
MSKLSAEEDVHIGRLTLAGSRACSSLRWEETFREMLPRMARSMSGRWDDEDADDIAAYSRIEVTS